MTQALIPSEARRILHSATRDRTCPDAGRQPARATLVACSWL